MKSATPGTSISKAEVTNTTAFGVWVLVPGVERFLPFESFFWFRSATVENICTVDPTDNHLYWPERDIDLAVESIDHPEHFPLMSQVAPQGVELRR